MPQCQLRYGERGAFDAAGVFESISPILIGTLILGCDYCDHRFKVSYIGNVKAKRFAPYDTRSARRCANGTTMANLHCSIRSRKPKNWATSRRKAGRNEHSWTETEIEAALAEMSRQILRDCRDPDRLLILGVRSVGSQLAQRIANEIESARQAQDRRWPRSKFTGPAMNSGASRPAIPISDRSNLKDREVILVDDVIYTGRTVKSALSIIFRSGRPQSVRLAVLSTAATGKCR